jgi:hypothetical protein
MMKRFAILGVMILVLGSALPGAALSSPPDNPNCWGVVTSQRATTYGDVGEHASDPGADLTPDRPGRAGLGNSPFGHVSNLGTFLSGLDDFVGQDPEGATSCP